jgi:hypothetical protein
MSKKLVKAIWLNCAAIAGIIIGLSSAGRSLSGQAAGRVAVFFFAGFNLLLLEAQPRLAQRDAEVRGNLYKEAWTAIAERPIISLLVLMQLWAVARCPGTVITVGRAYTTPQIASQHLQGRVVMLSTVMVLVGMLWLASAAGIWRRRAWAWWLAIALNTLDAGTTILIQVLKPNQFLIDPVAVLAIILLLLPSTRPMFRGKMTVAVLPSS